MIEQIYMLGYRHRAFVGLFLLLVTIFTAAGLQRLQIDTGIDSLIPADDPSRLVYQKVMREFGTQMERRFLWIDKRNDKKMEPRVYFTKEMWDARREEAALFI